MTKFKNKYRSESNRLQTWDYSHAGSYFITICTNGRLFRFGDVKNGGVENQTNKNVVFKHWNNLPQHYNNIELGEMVVMPNHIHFIITIVNDNGVDDGLCTVDSIHELNLQPTAQPTEPPSQQPPSPSLPPRLYQRRKMLLSKIVGRLKMQVAKEINIIENMQGQSFWQRNYYDRIIRNNDEYQRIQQYIKNNPANWEKDRNNETQIFM